MSDETKTQKWTPGAMRAAKSMRAGIQPELLRVSKFDVAVVAKIISRETRDAEMVELLRDWFECYLHGNALTKTACAKKTERLLAEINSGESPTQPQR